MYEDQIFKVLSNGENIRTLMLMILGFLIIEIGPFLYVLDWSFM